MSNLYSVLPGLTPSSQEIIEAELIAKQILEGKYPDLDLREGTGLRDLVLRPTAYAFALLKKATDYYFTQNTLATVDDSTPAEVVDDLLSNWFLNRNTGTKAVISVRLFFARAKNVTLTTDIGFSPDNKLYFFPEASQAYQSDSMSYDAYTNEWYLDVVMTAADTGIAYNISEGSLLYFSSFDPYFLRAEVNYLISESSPAETNTEFVSRASSAISTRNLINIPSIDSRLRQTFNYIDRVTTVGAGDSDMIRDMIRIVPKDSTIAEATGAYIDGSIVTFTLPGHTFQPGQILVLSGALPEDYNGQFTIQSVDVDNITLLIPGNPGYVSVLPSITELFSPVYVHNGGAVDVYCGTRLGTSIIQYTADSNGIIEVYGPVYSIARSNVSGGVVDDTIPTTNTVGLNYPIFLPTTGQVQLHLTESNVAPGANLRLYGLEQYAVITSISCTGLSVTVHTQQRSGVTEGSTIRVEGVVPDVYNGTYKVTSANSNSFTYTVPAQISGPGTGGGAKMRVYNPDTLLDPSISEVSGLVVTVDLPYSWRSTEILQNGVLSVEQDTPYSISYAYRRGPQDVQISVVSGIATVSLLNHGISAGRRVTIYNADANNLNGSWRVESVLSGSQFTLNVQSAAVLDQASTYARIDYVLNDQDLGFSRRQKLLLDFGNDHAGGTASFEVSSFRDIDGIQDYLDSPDNRVLCGDYLARGFNLTLVDVDVVSYGLTAFNTMTIQRAVESYLSGLSAGSTFVLSDLVSSFYKSGITNIQTPVGVKYTRYTRDLTRPETGVVSDYLDPNDKTNVFLLRGVTSSAQPL